MTLKIVNNATNFECFLLKTYDINRLTLQHSVLSFLQKTYIKSSEHRRWMTVQDSSLGLLMNTYSFFCIAIAFIGKTGYGKSTTINQLTGLKVFESDDVNSCTQDSQSILFYLHNHGKSLAFLDLPGLGESIEADKKYAKAYKKIDRFADCIVYLLRADQRDYAIDLSIFDEFFRSKKSRSKIVLALNFIDKIEPMHRKKECFLTLDQKKNLRSKVMEISEKFDIPSTRIVTYSANQRYNLKCLTTVIANILESRISF